MKQQELPKRRASDDDEEKNFKSHNQSKQQFKESPTQQSGKTIDFKANFSDEDD